MFAEGDHGDGFFVVEQCEVEVLIGGEHVRSLGAGASFGEIALLRGVPRTATIRATSDVRLQRLERAGFLGAVTGNAESVEAAAAVVGSRLGARGSVASLRPAALAATRPRPVRRNVTSPRLQLHGGPG